MQDWFPLDPTPGIPINAHPGAFGCARRHNFHEGVDLYGKSGDSVLATRSGVIVANRGFTGPKTGFPWWLDTDALLVQDQDGFFCYGELKSPLSVGTQVNAGDRIGQLVPVLPPGKRRPDIPGHSVTMLHLERYSNAYTVSMGWASWEKREDRPFYLLDPTNWLIESWRSSSSRRGSSLFPTLLTL